MKTSSRVVLLYYCVEYICLDSQYVVTDSLWLVHPVALLHFPLHTAHMPSIGTNRAV